MSPNVFGVLLTFASIPLVVLLLIVYYSKNQFNNAKTKLFRVMLWTLLIGAIVEIVKVFLINIDASRIALEIVSRCGFALETIWWYVLEMYTIISYKKETINNLKDTINYNKGTKILTIYYIVLVAATLFIPNVSTVKDIDINNIIYMPTMVVIVSIFVIGIQFVLSIYYYIKTRKDNYFKDDRLISVTVSISIIVYYIVQVLFPHVSFPMIFFTLFYYLTYFLNENPDLKLLKETNISRATIEASNKTKTNFLTNISNGIKTPIDSIVNTCNEINSSPVYNSDESKRKVDMILKHGNELIGVINNVLDVSKIESGDIVVTEIQYNTVDLIEGIIEVAKEKIGSKPIKIMIGIDKNISSILYGDYTKIYQSLVNIVSNAVKYTEVGRITIELTSIKDNDNEHLSFAITDTGTGIKDEEKETVFNRNENLSESTTLGEGLGLGLIITKKYIEAMGGRIWFESRFRTGTTFYIDLNQKIIDPKPIGDITNYKNTQSINLFDCSKYKALIVDDNLLNIKVAERLLKKYNFNVEYVTNGQECIDKIKSFEKYDVIFIDDVMSELDGIGLLHVLRNLQGYDIPPLIALTANAISGMKEIYIKEGFDDYLPKPINIYEFDKVINKFFNK